MWRYIVKRILTIIPVLLVVSILIFTIMYLTPGDPVEIMAPNATAEQMNELRDKFGLNDSYVVQLGRFLKQTFLEFNLGESYVNGRSVMEEILRCLPNTVFLALSCCILQIIVGIPLGISAARHQNKWQDSLCMLVALIGASIPDFVIALVLLLIFSFRLKWTPVFGTDTWTGWILPIVTMGLAKIGSIARLTRSSMLEVSRSDYVTTARMKGVPERVIRYSHELPNALIPVVTTLGASFAGALGGAVVIESVFSIGGVGTYMVTAIGNRDYPCIRGSVLVLSLLFCVLMLLIDLIYAYIDPRIKAQYENAQKRRLKVNG